ncbi:hypothetical protein [Parafrankia irregularis]|uniref:hypothetical protein n=1 Tax=Parafrankia irregularis TaxID=795642 RepID=UPI0010421E20|nr:hypothetical protein [Parafrankia irregularis]
MFTTVSGSSELPIMIAHRDGGLAEPADDAVAILGHYACQGLKRLSPAARSDYCWRPNPTRQSAGDASRAAVLWREVKRPLDGRACSRRSAASCVWRSAQAICPVAIATREHIRGGAGSFLQTVDIAFDDRLLRRS